MIKNILGKGEKEEISNDELKELKEKFKEITQENSVPASTDNAAQPATTTAPIQATAQPNPTATPQQEVFVDPQRVEENEKITNLIMQQIKELIEIDNNLNIKIKEMETKIRTNISNVSDLKNVVDKFHNRLEFIEKNIEKFMGLYEVVTNRFNPFIENQGAGEQKAPENNVAIPEIPKEDTTVSSPTQEAPQTTAPVQETVATPIVEKPKEGAPVQETVATPTTTPLKEDIQIETSRAEAQPTIEEPSVTTEAPAMPESENVKAAIQNVNIEDVPKETETPGEDFPTEPNELTQMILKNAGIEGKIYGEDLDIVVNDIKAMIIKLGNKVNQALIGDISQNLKKLINQLVVESIKTHSEINANQVKETIAKIRVQFLGDAATDTDLTLNASTEEVPVTPAENKPEETPKEAAAAEETQAVPVESPNPTEEATTPTASTDEVHSDYHFTTADGQEVKSVAGLIDVLKAMDDKTFAEHVNDSKNDFAMWVGLVNDNWELGEKMTSIKSKDEILAELEKIK